MELAKVKIHELKWTQRDSRNIPNGLLGLLINLHAWNHCPEPALSPKWLDHYMEPRASSKILTRSDLPTWLNPKPGGSGPKNFSSCAGPF